MARNSAPSQNWEERSTTAVPKVAAFLRGPDTDGFYHFSPDGPNDAEVVQFGDNFWGMTLVPDMGQTTLQWWEVGGFIHGVDI